MKLIKLTYLAQGWNLGLYREPLIWNDVEAWRYGPVFPEIYRHVAGKPNITQPLMNSDQADFSDRDNNLIDQVWAKYGQMTGLQLSSLTHQPGSPWEVTYRLHGQNAVIPKRLIEEHYAQMAT